MKYYLVYLNENERIRFECIAGVEPATYVFGYEPEPKPWELSSFLTTSNEWLGLSVFPEYALDYPNTNGVYIVDGQERSYKDAKAREENLPSAIFRKRFLILTERAHEKLMNREHVNTMSANPRLFYQGKFVDFKVFIEKQLLINATLNKKVDEYYFEETELDAKTGLFPEKEIG